MEQTSWIDYFLDGVIEISNEAIEIVEKITDPRVGREVQVSSAVFV